MHIASPFLALTLAIPLGGCLDEGGLDFDVPEPPECIDAEERAALQAIVSGGVTDFATGEPIDADVAVNTAWDVADTFPATCEPLATFTASAEVGFGPETVDVGTPRVPPIALFLVTGDDLADTASDQRLTCATSSCGPVDHVIAAPPRALADEWRRQMAEDGMPDAETRGLVLFRFNEADGSPAAGVVPRIFTGDPDLAPGEQVRFLEEDRVTLAPPDTAETTASGVAIIAIPNKAISTDVFGDRGEEDTWEPVGVLAPRGWLFLEDERPVPR